MRVFSIGGTGTISRAVTQLLTRRGVDLTLLNRGQRDTPRDVRSIHADPSRRAGRCGRAAQ